MNRTMQWAIAALVQGAAFGAAAQSNVMIYGRLDEALNYINNNGGTSRKSLDSNAAAKSRLGFSGSEDLGDGLRALFQLESNFSPDTGTMSDGARFFNRAALVGLSDRNLGTLTFGRQNDFLYIDLPRTSSPLLIGGQGGGWQAATGVKQTLQLDVHYGGVAWDNTVKWKGLIGPVNVGVMYGLGSENNKDKMASAFARYDSGPLSAGIGWVKDNFATSITAREVTSIGATYTAKGFVWFANSAWGKDPLTRGRIHPTEFGVTYDFTKQWMLGVDFAYVPVTTNNGTKATLTQPAIGAKYTLSKRTFLFSSLARNHSSDISVVAATLDRPGGATLPSTTNSQTGFRLGIQHNF